MWFLIGAVVGFLLIILVRGLLFRPQNAKEVISEEISFDSDKAVNSLCEMVRCKTVSYADTSIEDNAEFEKFIALLPKLFPKVFSVCEFTQLPDRALLLKWKGQSEGDATVLMAHYDVVPVDESGWEKPAFEGIVEDGVIWGRGTLDTKVSLNSALNAAEHLIANGFTPNNDIYFAFSGNEETNGKGAPNIVDYFEQNKINIGLVLDEGGAVVENVFPGVKAPCGLIGIAEKGMLNLEYKVASNGGHASSPKPNAPIDMLCSACGNVLHYPFRAGVSVPVAEMFDTLGRHSNLLYRIIFANLRIFFPLLDAICKKQGGELNALVRTTTAFTQMYHNQNFVVKDDDGKFAGIITLQNLQESIQMLEFSQAVMAFDIMEDSPVTCTPDMSIPELYKLYETYDTEAIPVVDKDGIACGVMEKPAVQRYLRSQVLALQKKLASLG